MVKHDDLLQANGVLESPFYGYLMSVWIRDAVLNNSCYKVFDDRSPVCSDAPIMNNHFQHSIGSEHILSSIGVVAQWQGV